MKSAVIVFPGSNCDRDMAVALGQAAGRPAQMVWHKETALPPGLDLVALPGGFSFGDYLRSGAIAARSPVMQAVIDFADKGGLVLGVCNGFQVLIEAGLLPGALMRNAALKFVCRDVHLRVETTDSPFTNRLGNAPALRVPMAHHDGNFVTDDETLAQLRDAERVAFTYCQPDGSKGGNPNGSMADIAGILSQNRRVLGMMPHPERLADPALAGGGTADGKGVFDSLIASLAPA